MNRCRMRLARVSMGWHTMMDFTPPLVGCVIDGGNHVST